MLTDAHVRRAIDATRRLVAIGFGFVVAFGGGGLTVAADAATRYPDFSWDTLPLYMHVRKSDAFSDEELDFLASFPLITLEKLTGIKSSGSTDTGTLAAAGEIKRRNPRAKILFYRNVFVHYPGYSFDERLIDIPQPFLVGRQGETKLVRGDTEAYDLSNPRIVDWWVDTARDVCESDVIDGLFLDGNIKVLTPYLANRLPAGKKQAIVRGYDDLIRRTRSALPKSDLMIANIIRAQLADTGLQYLRFFDGSYVEGFTLPIGDVTEAEYVAKGIEGVQQAARSGKIIAMTLGLGESAADGDRLDDSRAKVGRLDDLEKRVDYLVGLFLVCAEPYSYLFLHDGYAVDTRRNECLSKVWLKRFPHYDRPLGPPQGPARRRGYEFSRSFVHADVTIDVEKQQATIDWHPAPDR